MMCVYDCRHQKSHPVLRRPVVYRRPPLTMFLLAVFVVAILGALAVPGWCDDTLTIATLNCEFLVRSKVHVKFGYDLYLAEADKATWDQAGYRDNKFSEAAKAVASAIKSLNADVLVLVEVGDATDVAELKGEVDALGLSYPYSAVCDSSDTTTGQHVAVFSKRALTSVEDAIPGRECYDRELDDPETEDDTGVSKGMHVMFSAGGKPVHLYAVHLASERGGHEQDAQRVAQASIVRRHYLEALNNGEHVIVAGDLNDKRGDPAIRRIRGRDDIYGDLIQTGRPEFFEDADLGTRWTYEYEGVRQQIDHILISDSVLRSCKSGGVKAKTVPFDNPLVSDHRALVVKLTFKPN